MSTNIYTIQEITVQILNIIESMQMTKCPSLASQSRFDPNWAVAQDLELELKSKLEP